MGVSTKRIVKAMQAEQPKQGIDFAQGQRHRVSTNVGPSANGTIPSVEAGKFSRFLKK